MRHGTVAAAKPRRIGPAVGGMLTVGVTSIPIDITHPVIILSLDLHQYWDRHYRERAPQIVGDKFKVTMLMLLGSIN